MCEEVAVQVVLSLESLAALVAVVLSLLAVRQAVLGQRRRVAESLGARGACLESKSRKDKVIFFAS